ncbi:MAG: hypothetical protein AAFP13_12205 [Pseudomonadota bacterium]
MLGQPDRLAGGFGNDLITGHGGATITGSAGEDMYGVAYYQADADPVLFTEPVDAFGISVTDALNAPLSQSYDADADTLSIFVGDAQVAQIAGRSSIDLDGIFVDVVPDDFDIEDLLFGELTTGPGDDFVDSDGYGNSISTGDGNDTVTGGLSNDRVDLGAGDDVYVAAFPEFTAETTGSSAAMATISSSTPSAPAPSTGASASTGSEPPVIPSGMTTPTPDLTAPPPDLPAPPDLPLSPDLLGDVGGPSLLLPRLRRGLRHCGGP